MSAELYPLAVYPFPPTEADVAAIKAAKAALQTNFLVTLCPAVPGSPTVVLALREPAPFVVDQCVVSDPSDPTRMKAALQAVLFPNADDPRVFTVLKHLQAILGPEVSELPNSPEGVTFR